MRKFVLFAVTIALLASMGLTAYAAPPPDGPPGLERAIEAQEAHTDRLLNISGVVGTAVGFGENGLPAVKIYTGEQGVKGLPAILEGVPVEIVVTGRFYARYDPTARQERPVPIGVSTGHPDITAGTIGARVTDGNDVYALSNNHVYANSNKATIGDSVLQPGSYDGGTDPADSIGTLHDFEPLKFDGSANYMDAAIALSSTGSLDNETLPDGYGVPGSTVVNAFIGQAVQKYGRTTGLTTGSVSDINVNVNVCYRSNPVGRCTKSAMFVDQIAITPGAFSDGGDSGSLIVDANNNPVGLLFAGSDTHTIASPIGPVLERFGVVIDSGQMIDAPPTVSIVAPAEGDTVSGTVTVTADASDDNSVTQVEFFVDGSTSIGVDSNGSDGWSASWDTTAYAEGSHTVSATATDTIGQTASDSNDVTVDNVNDPPMASFTYTCSGLACDFDASGSNDPDGSIVIYDWDFGDEVTGSGVTATHTYAAGGTYDVKLIVTDNDGATDTISKPVTVSGAVATVSVSSITYATEGGKNSDRHLLITVSLLDDLSNPVAGASVSIKVDRDNPYSSGTGTTGTDGTVTFKLTNAPSGTYTTTVTDVTAEGLTWDDVTPENSFTK